MNTTMQCYVLRNFYLDKICVNVIKQTITARTQPTQACIIYGQTDCIELSQCTWSKHELAYFYMTLT